MRDKQIFPRIQLPSPILALAGDGQGSVWAGGTGGVAYFDPQQGWTPLISGLPLSAVSGLAAAGEWLFAGGAEGLARYSVSAANWQTPQVEGESRSIAALAVSPDFGSDQSVLAASLESGIFRSEDAGATWHSSNFGLHNFEVTALAWAGSGLVIAGTAGGIFRSPNGGRAWRVVDSTAGTPIAAVVSLAESRFLAVTDDGVLLTSGDNGASWQPLESNLPDDIMPTACYVFGGLILLGTSGGLFASLDGGRGWQPVVADAVLALGVSGGLLYAGTGRGLLGSEDGGQTWHELPLSPLHDLRRIQRVNGQIIVSGGYSVTVRARADHTWQPLLQVPLPLSLLKVHGTRLFASGPDGLFISDDAGDSWQHVLGAQQGHLAYLALLDDGRGWGISADSAHLLRTTDGGLRWEIAHSPLGADRVVALEASADLVFAATYSTTQQIARLWYSQDDGVKWNRGAEAKTRWGVVATLPQPPMVSLGNAILAQGADASWQTAQMPPDGGLVRRVVASGSRILALTTSGVQVSLDNAVSFAPLEGVDLPTDQMMDIALDGETLYVLSVGGLVSAFDLSA